MDCIVLLSIGVMQSSTVEKHYVGALIYHLFIFRCAERNYDAAKFNCRGKMHELQK